MRMFQPPPFLSQVATTMCGKRCYFTRPVVNQLYFPETHEWFRYDEEKQVVTLGITEKEQLRLGEIVFFAGNVVGTSIYRGNSIGIIEGSHDIKSIIAPCNGTIYGVNQEPVKHPELINLRAEKLWLISIKVSGFTTFPDYTTKEEYEKHQ